MRRSLLPAASALALLLAGALADGAAGAATDVVPSPTPLAIRSAQAPPACPTAAEVDGSLVAGVVRRIVQRAARTRDEEALFTAGLVTSVLQRSATIAMCDPALAAAGLPLGSFSGTAAAPPAGDLVGFGVRYRTGSTATKAAGLAPGDRIVLPSAGAQAVIDVAVRTVNGVGTVRLGPFSAPASAVRVSGTSAAPAVVAELTDGSTTQASVTVPTPVETTATARVSGTTLRVRLRTAPGAVVQVSTPAREGSLDLFAGIDERGSLSVANAAGVANASIVELGREDRRAIISILDPDRRRGIELSCALRWKGQALRSARCVPAASSARRSALAPGTRTASPVSIAGRLARAAVHRRLPSAMRGHGAAALQIAPTPLTTAFRAAGGGGLDPDDAYEADPLFGDVNGDGRPDFTIGDPTLGTPQLLLSRPGAGWTSVPVKGALDELLSVGDLSGDGVDDFTQGYDDRIFSGRAIWATTPPAAIDMSKGVGLYADDLAIGVAGEAGGEGPLDEDGRVFPMADGDGDGRPEVGAPAGDGPGVGIFSSTGIPLGLRTALPAVTTAAPASAVPLLEAIGRAGLDDLLVGLAEFDEPSVLAVRGRVVVASTRSGGKERAIRSTTSVHQLAPSAPWALTGGTVDLGGMATVRDVDPTTGESLVRTVGERCSRDGECVTRLRRLDANGRILATASLRSGGGALDARFTADGPDADTRPDVLLHDDEPVPGEKPSPGFGGTVALWPSATAAARVDKLAVIGSRGKPLVLAGKLLTWTAPNGTRAHGGIAVTGSGRRAKTSMVIFGAAG